jgi:hypothetical protein
MSAACEQLWRYFEDIADFTFPLASMTTPSLAPGGVKYAAASVARVVKIVLNASSTPSGGLIWNSPRTDVNNHIRITDDADPTAALPVAAITLFLGDDVC